MPQTAETKTSAKFHIRRAAAEDLDSCARILFEGFKSIAARHNFPPDFPSLEAACQAVPLFLNNPKSYGVVAESEGKIIGSNFLDERNEIRAVGPITVDPAFQGKGAGRLLMKAVIERAAGSRGVRLVQDAFNTVSISLYTSLGFDPREPLFLVSGRPVNDKIENYSVRLMKEGDLAACSQLHRKIHGFDRGAELKELIPMFGPVVLERGGKISAYASAPHFWPLNHGVAESEKDLQDWRVDFGKRSARLSSPCAPGIRFPLGGYFGIPRGETDDTDVDGPLLRSVRHLLSVGAVLKIR